VGWGLGFENLLVGGFRKEDGFSLTTCGNDEATKMDPRRLPAKMTDKGKDGCLMTAGEADIVRWISAYDLRG